MNQKEETRFTGETRKKLQEEIQDAGGNEVFALGRLNKEGLVDRIEVRARGNEVSVLALGDFGFSGETFDVFIHNHPSGFLTPSDNDLMIAGQAAEEGIGCYIVDNQVEQVYVVAEPIRKKKRQKLNPEKIITALEQGGAIARRLPAYEARRAQLDLMRMVIEGFNKDAIVAAEAGTGVGKSFAYLLPALSHAVVNEERVIISTATITLQQQLYEKDIPLVLSAMKKKVKAVLMKGRGNYLCRRRLEEALSEQAYMSGEERAQLEAIRVWTGSTKSGSRSDLSFLPQEGLWSKVCSEADLCMGMRCPEREDCFVLALRRDCADAGIIVVNHHLLFADMAARHQGAGYDGTVVLPPYNRVIIDEAHTAEASATSFFSREFSRPGLLRHLGRLYRNRLGARAGLLVRLAPILYAEATFTSIEKLATGIREGLEELDTRALELCQAEGAFRLTPGKESLIQAALVPSLSGLRGKIASLIAVTRELLEAAEDQEDKEKDLDEAAVWETKSTLRRLDTIASVCGAFIEYKDRTGEVMWLERISASGDRAIKDWVRFTVTPLDVAPSLKEALFAPNKTVVCVSATLTVAGSFDYWASRCGLGLLKDREVYTGQFPSPFPYASSVLLAVPNDAPLPDDHETYRNFVDRAVTELTLRAGGSALVLFTSYEALKSAYKAARPLLEGQGIACLKQGDDERSRLLKSFLEDEGSVLFATDSFWEGVDAPGDTLRMVVLCRLPFKTPNEPVFQARCEALESRGGNSFMELSLPESVMKFKQGFGRLMRRSSDRGVVAVLDGRLLRKRYGAYFLRSLPKTRKSFADFDTVLRETESFLF
jgi:ATP-dependent DNA helicase DinG